MKKQNLLVISILVFLALNSKIAIAAISQPASMQATPCSASELSFSLDDKNGYFNGMSQSGILLVLHNVGLKACSVPARPIVNFEDAEHRVLPISLRTPLGMHPGPVILPTVIPAGAWATSEMRWVSSDAYNGNNCISPTFITISVGQDNLRFKFTGSLCGPSGKNPAYTLTLFKHDLTYISY